MIKYLIKIIVFLLLTLLIGCSNYILFKEGVTESEFQKDRVICEDKAYALVGRAPPWDDNLMKLTSWKRELKSEYYKCMYEKGYIRK
jgi:hypothetical protein